MIQLQVLTGSSAGRRLEADRFPITVGRAPDCSLSLSDPGVFDRHFEIQFSDDGYTLQSSAHAVVTINGERAEQTLLRNGDLIVAGYAKLQFWLGALIQRGPRVREALAWLLILAVAGVQAYCLFRLLVLAR
jgi:predicted component of type VI protein secretion system